MGFITIESDGGILITIYSTTGGGKRPIHGAYYADVENGWVPISWYPDGTYNLHDKPCALDIRKAINDKEIKENQSPPTIQETT